MRLPFLLTLVLLVVAAGCSRAKRYPLTGQVIAVDASRGEMTVKHEDVKGFMPGMTMPFKVRDAEALKVRKPGDTITATLVVEESTGYLEDIAKTGEAPLPPEAAERQTLPMIEPGAAVPDAEFVDQAGTTRHVRDWRGKTIAVTFIYTRCPLPEFCPLMDRHFATLQQQLEEDPALAARVHLVSVSFDPDYDTPAVLRQHAERVGADPAHWSFVTGPRQSVDAFAGAFGVAVMRGPRQLDEIVHNLRTAVIAPDGTLSRVFNGNEWQPNEVMVAIREADGRR